MKATQATKEHIWIEVTREGVIGVHADIADTPFLNLIGPAITYLDRTIQDVQKVINSKAFAQVMHDAAAKLAEQTETTDAVDTATHAV